MMPRCSSTGRSSSSTISSGPMRWCSPSSTPGRSIQTDIRYIIKSTLTDQVLFDRKCQLYLDLSVDSSNGNKKNQSLLGALLDVAVGVLNTALTDQIEAARKANYYIFQDLPVGKYDDLYLKDQDIEADPKNVNKTVK